MENSQSLEKSPSTADINFKSVLPPLRTVAGMKQDTFSLDEGSVVLQWPSHMSKASYEDFKDWIELQMRKIQRSVQ